MKAKEILKKRRRDIYDLVLMGENQKNIAIKFKMTERQVRRDLKIIRAEGVKELDNTNTKERCQEYADRSLMRRKRHWLTVADKTSTKSEKNQALRELRAEDEFCTKMDQRVGLIPKEVSPLISIESNSKEGHSENKVQINIIAPTEDKKEEVTNDNEEE